MLANFHKLSTSNLLLCPRARNVFIPITLMDKELHAPPDGLAPVKDNTFLYLLAKFKLLWLGIDKRLLSYLEKEVLTPKKEKCIV